MTARSLLQKPPGEHVTRRVASRRRPTAAAGVWPDGSDTDGSARALLGHRLVLALLAAGLLVLYGPIAAGTLSDCWNDENYSHGVLVPVVVLALVLQRRRDIVLLPPRTARRVRGLAWALLAAGAAAFVVGCAGAESFTQRMSGVLVLVGLAGVLGGPWRLRRYGPPLALLACAVPLPYVIYYSISFPMQLLSARLASGALAIAGFDVVRTGNIFQINGHALEVVDACSGIRSMMALATVALVAAVGLRLGVRRGALLTAAALPVALFGNIVRLVVTALLVLVVGGRATRGALHEGVGMAAFLVSVALLGALVTLLRRRASARSATRPGRSGVGWSWRGLDPRRHAAWIASLRVGSVRAAWIAVLVLAVAGTYGTWVRTNAAEPSGVPQLEKLPLEFAGLVGEDIPLDDRVLDKLRPASYVFRSYRGTSQPPVGLYVAYYLDPQEGAQVHSPLHCYPGAGWKVVDSEPLEVRDLRGRSTRMQRLVVRKGERDDVVVYWYDTRTGRMTNDFDLKFNLVRTALLHQPRDAAFVRWSTPIAADEDVQAATARLLATVAHAYPELESALPFGG